MFKDIVEYMKLSSEERKSHLNLDEPCIEIGGSNSTQYKGLLAHFLKTTIPHGFKNKVYLCHACNNHSCSNTSHLYWGTPKDNHLDQVEAKTWTTISERVLNKYGKEASREMRRKAGSLGGLAGGGHNKGKTSIDLTMWKNALDGVDTKKYGWQTAVARNLGTTHTTVKRIVKKYFPQLLEGYPSGNGSRL